MARYWGVPPWEVEEMDLIWFEEALSQMGDKNWAEAERYKRNRHKH